MTTASMLSPPTPIYDEDLSLEEISFRHREACEDLGECVLETDLTTAAILWGNRRLLDVSGYSLDELSKLTVPQVMPSAFHEVLSERRAGRRGALYVFPFIGKTGAVFWFLAWDLDERHPRHWARGRLLMQTEPSGQAFDVMSALMAVANLGGEHTREQIESIHRLSGELRNVEDITSGLDTTTKELSRRVSELAGKVDNALRASRSAADHSIRTNQMLISLKSSFEQTIESLKTTMEKSTERKVEHISEEVMKLIAADVRFNKQIELIHQEFQRSAEDASTSIRAAAKGAERSFSKKVTFPVGVVGGLLLIVNQLLENPEILARLVLWLTH